MAKCFVLSNKYRTLSESPTEMSWFLLYSYLNASLVVLSLKSISFFRIKTKH